VALAQKENFTTKRLARHSRNRKNRNISRKGAKPAKKIPLSSPFGKGGERGILPTWRPADRSRIGTNATDASVKEHGMPFPETTTFVNFVCSW
jgi:hypothetical protein